MPIGTSAPRTAMIIASALLSIIGACLFLLAGILGFFTLYQIQQFSDSQSNALLLLGVLSFLGFALALSGGILVLDRAHFQAVILILLIATLAPLVALGVALQSPPSRFSPPFWSTVFFFLDAPAMILCALALAFALLRKQEFAKI